MLQDDRLSIDNLRERFLVGSPCWWVYKSATGKLRLSHEPLKRINQKLMGISRGNCHKHTLAAAKKEFAHNGK